MTKNLFSLLAILFLTCSILTGCNSSAEERTSAAASDTSYERLREEERERQREADAEADKPKLNDSDNYWNWHNPQPAASPSSTPRPTETELSATYRRATENENTYDASVQAYKDATPKERKNLGMDWVNLGDAFKGFATVAQFKPAVLADVKRTFDKLMLDKSGPGPNDTVIELHQAFPHNTVVQEMLVTVHARYSVYLNKELKEAHYNLGIRYTRAAQQALYKKGYGLGNTWPNDCMYDVSHFRTMRDLARALGNEAEYSSWTLRTADYFSSDHGCETEDSDFWGAYYLYQEAHQESDAREMALLVAEEVFSSFLNGRISEWYPDRLLRHPLLPYDLQLAKEWLAKAGMNEEQIDQWLKATALKTALKSEEKCRDNAYPHRPLNFCELAERQYEFAGDLDNATRMGLMKSKS